MPARCNDLFDRNLMDAIREFCRWQDRTRSDRRGHRSRKRTACLPIRVASFLRSHDLPWPPCTANQPRTAMVLLTGGMGGIYWVGSRPKFARRGLGTLCTVTVANAAFELGKPMVGLHSTPMGQAVYERLGFEHAPTGHRWYVMT